MSALDISFVILWLNVALCGLLLHAIVRSLAEHCKLVNQRRTNRLLRGTKVPSITLKSAQDGNIVDLRTMGGSTFLFISIFDIGQPAYRWLHVSIRYLSLRA